MVDAESMAPLPLLWVSSFWGQEGAVEGPTGRLAAGLGLETEAFAVTARGWTRGARLVSPPVRGRGWGTPPLTSVLCIMYS